MNWIIMPVVNGLEMTRQALSDCLNQQGVDPRVLVILQGGNREIRESLEGWAEREPRLLIWVHDPPLPSLSSTWNRALRFVWECGGQEALVVNNDVRLHRQTYDILRKTLTSEAALFVTAVGVRADQFDPDVRYDPIAGTKEGWLTSQRGGPDFSCFLISSTGHWKYAFDEHFVPAYCEDLDAHRRYMLGGDGPRIFSVNLPYLHYASNTLKEYTPEQRTVFAKRVQGSRDYYARKWGGPVNQERFTVPFGPQEFDGVTTPDLQRRVQAGEHPLGSPFVDQVIANQEAPVMVLREGD